MLVLSRQAQEQICIGDGIVLTVLEIHGRRVKVGIEAPRDMSVRRGELVAFEPEDDQTRKDVA